MTSLIPDLHHYRGSFGGKDVIPLWRDAGATQPNVTRGLLDALGDVLDIPINPEDLFAYCYAVLSAPDYAERFSEDLSVPGPRLPITRDGALFARAVELGRRLVALHTFGERFDSGAVPPGNARVEKAITPTPMPERYRYDPASATLHIGTGEVCPVPKDVWEFSVSGYEVLQRWLDFRMAGGAGRRSSGLDGIRPTSWPPRWTTELLELIWVLEATVALWPALNKLQDEVVAGPCFDASELPTPTPEELQPPKLAMATPGQGTLLPEQHHPTINNQ